MAKLIYESPFLGKWILNLPYFQRSQMIAFSDMQLLLCYEADSSRPAYQS